MLLSPFSKIVKDLHEFQEEDTYIDPYSRLNVNE